MLNSTIFVELFYSTPCIVYNRQADVSKSKECDWVPCLLWILHAWDQWANIWQTGCVIKKNHHSVWSRYLHFTQFVHSHDWRKPISKYNNISYLIGLLLGRDQNKFLDLGVKKGIQNETDMYHCERQQHTAPRICSWTSFVDKVGAFIQGNAMVSGLRVRPLPFQ